MLKQPKDEVELRRNKHKIIDIKPTSKSRNVCLVPLSWYKDFADWLNRTTSTPPGKINNESLMNKDRFNNKMKFGKDFAVVENEIWDLIVKNFGKTPKIERYFVLEPGTNKPCVIIDGINLHIEVEGMRKIKKMTDPKWKVGPIVKQLCEALKIDNGEYVLMNGTGTENISTEFSIEEVNKKYPGVLLLKKIEKKNKIQIAEPAHTDKLVSSPFFSLPDVNYREKTPTRSSFLDNFQKQKVEKEEDETFVLPTERIPHPIGLRNIGNTCFFNAALQCLFRVQKLTDFVFSDQFEKNLNTSNPKGSGGKIARAYRSLLAGVCTSKTALSPDSLRMAITSKYKRFNNYQQHDSQEMIGAILDGLHEDMNQAAGKAKADKPDKEADSWDLYKFENDSPIMKIFHGEYINEIVCPKCNKSDTTHDPFLFFSVPIPDSFFGGTSLSKCIQKFSAVDVLDKNNTWNCPFCKNSVQAKKSLKVYKCPQVLIVHLKRFNQATHSKITTSVDYPDILDSGDFVTSNEKYKYKLIGVVIHSGSLFGGHYTACALTQTTNKWHLYDDSRVTEISQKSAHVGNAYVLFYQRI